MFGLLVSAFPRFGVPAFLLGVSGLLVGPAAFKAVEGSLARLLAGSIPVHSRSFVCASVRLFFSGFLGRIRSCHRAWHPVLAS